MLWVSMSYQVGMLVLVEVEQVLVVLSAAITIVKVHFLMFLANRVAWEDPLWDGKRLHFW